jgi:hypothetical protein
MVLYAGFLGPSTMLCSSRRREMPFNIRGSGDEWDIVEVTYLISVSRKNPMQSKKEPTLRLSSNLGCNSS